MDPSTLTIVSSVCTDSDTSSKYPQLAHLSPSMAGLFYWKCALVFFASCRRFHPNNRLIFFLNHADPIQDEKGRVLQDFLKSINVEIEVLPFSFCPPDGYSVLFKNAFFKFDVIKRMGSLSGESLLLDTDCVCTKPFTPILQAIQEHSLLLYDIYENPGPDTAYHGLSPRIMGKEFRQIDPDYPVEFPVWFGGEFFGTIPERACFMANHLAEDLAYILEKYPEAPPKFSNGKSIFDGMELFANFSYNRHGAAWTRGNPFLRRIWTNAGHHNLLPADVHKPIWHLPAEKHLGFALLFEDVMRKDSAFWTLPLEKLPDYMGGLLCVPKRSLSGFLRMNALRIRRRIKRHLGI